jgi:hypothetical protein
MNNLFFIIFIILLIFLFLFKTNKIEKFKKIKKTDKMNFSDFNLLNNKIIKIENVSYNSFVYKLEYIKNNKKYFSILKSNIGSSEEDNLFYEFQVGLFINKQIKKFPCFIKTYNIFVYKDKKSWDNFKNNLELENDEIKKSLKDVKNKNIKNIKCNNYYGLLIQYVNNSNSLKEMLNNIEFINNELMNVLFQIYFPLISLIDKFSHNDLNYNNILIVKVINNEFINFNYVLNDEETIIIKTQYIVKIIDYGNTYFYENKKLNTNAIYKILNSKDNCLNDSNKYNENIYYKKHIIENYLINDIILNYNRNFNDNNEIINYLKTINEINIKLIFEKILKYFRENKKILNINDKTKNVFIFKNGKNMKI